MGITVLMRAVIPVFVSGQFCRVNEYSEYGILLRVKVAALRFMWRAICYKSKFSLFLKINF